jgi:hypothetical protein
MDELREIRRRPFTPERSVMSSSVRPSLKNSLSGSALRLTNGSTAIDFTAWTSGVPAAAAMGSEGVCARRSSATTSAPVACRSQACFPSNRITVSDTAGGTPGRRSATGGGDHENRLEIVAEADGASNATWPVSISYRTHPSANRSLRPSMASPDACSGLL